MSPRYCSLVIISLLWCLPANMADPPSTPADVDPKMLQVKQIYELGNYVIFATNFEQICCGEVAPASVINHEPNDVRRFIFNSKNKIEIGIVPQNTFLDSKFDFNFLLFSIL